jgi:hypothetical protein
MRKLGLLGVSLSAAVICAAVPVSPNWSPAKAGLFTQDKAEARPVRRSVVVRRPVVRRPVAAVSSGRTGVGVGFGHSFGPSCYGASGNC